MKLDYDSMLVMTAMTLGVGQMGVSIKEVYMKDNIESYNFQSVFIGIIASSLWMVYMFRKGANYSAVYMSAGLVLQLYILQKLLSKSRAKKDTQSKM
jgi:hypothetical protein